MNALEEDIRKGSFHRVYLLFGEETYLTEYYSKQLIQALFAQPDSMNLTRYHGKDISVVEVISQAETLPFFASHRLLVIRDSGFFKKGCDALADYLPQIPDTSILLFVETEVDKRTRIYKALKKNGLPLECAKRKEGELETWVASYLKKNGYRIEKRAASMLVRRTGLDMNSAASEMEKLIAYAGDRKDISMQDVELICSEQPEDRVFQMIDAAITGEKMRAMQLYRDLLYRKEPPLRTLAIIGSQFRRLLLIKDLQQQGYGRSEAEQRSKLSYYAAREMFRQGEQVSLEFVQSILEMVSYADAACKSGRMDEKTGLEWILSEIMKAK